MMNRYLFLFVFITISFTLSSQEVISHLLFGPTSKDIVAKSKIKNGISLPFIDDFSSYSFGLDTNLWYSGNVFLNSTYPINPPTIGVATFDGLNANGLAYAIDMSIPEGYADTLISQEIDLSNISTAFFLFYYQPQGIGDNPEIQDSLILEFKDVNGDWNVQWKKEGDYSYEFKKHVVLINTSDYLIEDFQFRFRNKATLSGNFDHWHIDYIKLDEYINPSDTASLEDVSFVYSSPSFLSRYNEMPWSHFLNNEALEIKDTLDVLIRNNNSSINVEYQYNVYDDVSLVAHYPTIGVSRNVTILNYDSIGNFSFSPPISVASNTFSSIMLDSVSFNIEHIIGTGINDYKKNDTIIRTQNFFSHFSYDDGIAESAYGINVDGAKIAYQFKLNRPDTLRAIQMYFPQMLDSVNQIPFKLTIWSDIFASESIIYQQEVYPFHTDYGEFHTYRLDSLFQLVGTFYVGWEQTTDDLLNIGLDKNLHANQYMHYNVGSGWMNSQFPGAWMIRPIVSQKPLPLVTSESNHNFTLYPNPANSNIFINTNCNNNRVSFYTLQGVLVKQVYIRDNMNNISISDLPAALYIVELENNFSKKYEKLLVY